MANYKFASLNFPDKYGYIFNDEGYSSNYETHRYFRRFETMGDGLIQHSVDCCVPFEYLTDYLESLAAAIVKDDLMVKTIGWTLQRHAGPVAINFAASVVWRESDNSYDKGRYFSLKEEKIGSRKAKEHDKRYEAISSLHDGSCTSILRILSTDYMGGFERYCLAEEIRLWAGEQKKHPGWGDRWPEWFGGDWGKNNDLRRALQVCRDLCQSVRLRQAAIESLDYRRAERERAAALAVATPVVAE